MTGLEVPHSLLLLRRLNHTGAPLSKCRQILQPRKFGRGDRVLQLAQRPVGVTAWSLLADDKTNFDGPLRHPDD